MLSSPRGTPNLVPLESPSVLGIVFLLAVCLFKTPLMLFRFFPSLICSARYICLRYIFLGAPIFSEPSPGPLFSWSSLSLESYDSCRVFFARNFAPGIP